LTDGERRLLGWRERDWRESETAAGFKMLSS
jgi:hypothetical protein